MSWAATFCDELAALKRNGWRFEPAWEVAVDHQPPRLRELGAREHLETLEEVAESDRALAWYKACCHDAWFGQPSRRGGPSRLNLLPGLLGAVQDSGDLSAPARKHKLKTYV